MSRLFLTTVQRRAYNNKPRFLAGKSAVVTGSTSGIGAGFAEALASQGANVLINGFGDAKEIDALKQSIANKYGVKVEYHGADLSKKDVRLPNRAVREMIKFAEGKFGSVDVLVNNAGIQFVAPVEEFPDDKWEAIMNINLSSVFYATKSVVPLMKRRGWGRIINTASVHGLVASANKSAYVAAKHGVVGFTKSVALELAGSGITVNCINPGWVRTPLVEKQIEDKAKAANISIEDAARALLSEKQPSKQFVTIEQLGGLINFLCSPAADQITGISVPVDGGWVAQ